MLGSLIYSKPGHLIRRAHQLAWAAFMEETKDLDITPVQYSALVAVAEFPGIDATRISQLISFDRATIGNVLGRLQKKGLLTRSNHAKDRRVRQTFLTPKGQRTIDIIKRRARKVSESILAPLSVEERRTLLPLLAKLARRERATRPRKNGGDAL